MCLESLSTGIYFHYASCCVSDKSFLLLGLNTGDLSSPPHPFFHTFFTVQRLIGGLGWNSAGTKTLILDEGFWPIICACTHVGTWICLRMCLSVCKNELCHLQTCLYADLTVEWGLQIAVTDWSIICPFLLDAEPILTRLRLSGQVSRFHLI